MDSKSFYWYDLETSGTDARWDRIVQFAGLRTGPDLEPLGDEYCTYVELPEDVLPNPDASLITGITPQLCRREGISEWTALTEINRLFSSPGTCVAGYNSLRFDDEFIRHGFYRVLLDPYAREWQHNNSRWDLIDLVRATGALRRDGIEWPTTEEGLPLYKLEALTAANGLEHGRAHDAMSDVRATLALARLIRDRQPRLFEFYFGARRKQHARQLLEPFGTRICVHVSGMYPRERFCLAPVLSLCRHPTNANSIIVADLGQDVEPWLSMTAEEMRQALFTRGDHYRPPLKEIRINRCPFIAGVEVLTEENRQRLGIELRRLKERARRLRQPGLPQTVSRVYGGRQPERSPDVEGALYEKFLQEDDRSRCQTLQAALADGRWQDLDFGDERLVTLAERLKARSFPDWLSAAERADWQAFVCAKLRAREAPWLTLDGFYERLDALQAGELADDQVLVLAALREHADALAAACPE